jgi:hypothetical protein
MASEAVKKRGRPKKVITEAVEVDIPEGAKKTTTRAKSTKAAPKTAKPTTSTPAPSPSVISAPELAAKPVTPQKSTAKASPPTAPSPKAQAAKAEAKAAAKVSPKVTPESSKILDELRQQSTKSLPGHSSSAEQPTTSISPKTPQPPRPQARTSTTTPPKAMPAPTPPLRQIPIAGLNKQIVGDIASRAGARPNAGGAVNPLPKNYKSVANKVTLAIVAMPVALVTSWVLYERCEYLSVLRRPNP